MNLEEHLTSKQALDRFEESILEAAAAPQWMAVVWKIEDGMITLSGRTCWEFPTGDFDNAIGLLKQTCDSEKERLKDKTPPPLKKADDSIFQPVVMNEEPEEPVQAEENHDQNE